jgi:NAD(P)-dependent dehydrogenase (short-subunit alcohol dehydrogenase family)
LIIQSSEYRHIRDKDISRQPASFGLEIVKFRSSGCATEFKGPSDNWGLPDDFAGITIFLASAASDFVTGTAIP